MVGEEIAHRQGRGEMKYEVFKQLDNLKKEIALESIPEHTKRRMRSLITIIENRLQKL